MSNIIKRNIKKQTNQERIDEIGRVQFKMFIKLDIMSKELRKIQDMLGVANVKHEEE